MAEEIKIEFGKVETVYNWEKDHCASQGFLDGDVQDEPVRAYLDYTGKVRLFGSDDNNRQMKGDNLSDLTRQCGRAMVSDRSAIISNFNDSEYLMSPYTENGKDVYALVHNEYHGWEHGNCSAGVGSIDCYVYATNLAKSNNGGDTFFHETPPNQNIVHTTIPYRMGDANPGYSGPGRIVKKDGYYYALVSRLNEMLPTGSGFGVCLMRTNDLSQASSWKFWDGSGFNISAGGQGKGNECKALNNLGNSSELAFNKYLGEYINISGDWTKTSKWNTSKDLINWNAAQTFSGEGQVNWAAYATLIQPGDESRNFEVTGRSPWFYYVTPGSPRNLERVRVRFSKLNDVGRYELIDLNFSEKVGTKTLDSSFYGNDGILQGDVIWGENNFLKFNGNGRVVVSNSDSLKLSGKVTFKIKMKVDSLAPKKLMTLVQKIDGLNKKYGVYITTDDKLFFSAGMSGSYTSAMSDQAITRNVWHEVVITVDDSKKQVQFFVDGKASGTRAMNGTLENGLNDGSLVIGNEFVGQIDRLSILNYIDLDGDANGDGVINLVDFAEWKKEYLNTIVNKADFNESMKVDLVDFGIWKRGYLGI